MSPPPTVDQNDPGPVSAGFGALLLLLLPPPGAAAPPEGGAGSSETSRPSRQARSASWKLAADSASSNWPSATAVPLEPAPPAACGALCTPPKLTRFCVSRSPALGGLGAISASFFLNFRMWPAAMPISCMWLSCISFTTSMQSKPCSRKRPTYRSSFSSARNCSTSRSSSVCRSMAVCRLVAAAEESPPAAAVAARAAGAGAAAAALPAPRKAPTGPSCACSVGVLLPLALALPERAASGLGWEVRIFLGASSTPFT
mmetsp:Transcript_108796/g.307747  ORF Transcript_108796/g.307747 Transcript_108796/m.307747 type:complete len:258 (+) Transcript_108796:318-1091(+)